MYKAMYKAFIKKVNSEKFPPLMSFGQVMNFFIEVAEAKKEEEAKKKLTELRDSPRTVEMFMKTFSYKDSKFKTICHADFWTSQIMFSLNEDGKQFPKPPISQNTLQLLLTFVCFRKSKAGQDPGLPGVNASPSCLGHMTK